MGSAAAVEKMVSVISVVDKRRSMACWCWLQVLVVISVCKMLVATIQYVETCCAHNLNQLEMDW